MKPGQLLRAELFLAVLFCVMLTRLVIPTESPKLLEFADFDIKARNMSEVPLPNIPHQRMQRIIRAPVKSSRKVVE